VVGALVVAELYADDVAFFALLYASLALCEILDPQLLNVVLKESKNPPFILRVCLLGIYNIL
jgi:hypothetical protein